MTLPDESRLDRLCSSLFGPDEPGAAIGILGPGGFRYAKGVGLANLEQGIGFSPQTAFRACSITKQFVCLLVRQLEQEGKIALDAHPSRYVPALTAFPATLTVRHLCQNRSGLLDYWCAAMLTGACSKPPEASPVPAARAAVERVGLGVHAREIGRASCRERVSSPV